ncbi:alpha/beta hydrolase [Filobacillus milosensis]|uniref:Alpha/beta hydrolase n=1 Tax=Filobacillus milosensis TaxID=94137 RepID=A0A4Y8IGC2_9BACI|nr:alpha/beta hydrolase [Filobacillus milosensis]TFB13803.1 alpha/beta hydrolase [Filobacillus milosensis]
MIVKETEQPKGVVVAIHGAFEHAGRYEWLFSRINFHGYHVVAGDLPGQGTTPGRRGHIQSFQQYLDTVLSWFEKAKEYDLPIFLLGHSMGGLIAIRTMQKTDVYKDIDGVILSSPALGMKNGLARPVYYLSKVLNVATPGMRFKTGVRSEIATRNEGYNAHDVSDPLFLRKVSVRWYHEFEKAIAAAFKELADYPDIPTLLLQGGDDHLVDIDAVKEWFNKIDVSEKMIKIYEEFYHEIFNEPEREDVVKDLIHFIDHQIETI